MLFAILFCSAPIYYLTWLKYWDEVTNENRCYQTGDASSMSSEGTPVEETPRTFTQGHKEGTGKLTLNVLPKMENSAIFRK